MQRRVFHLKRAGQQGRAEGADVEVTVREDVGVLADAPGTSHVSFVRRCRYAGNVVHVGKLAQTLAPIITI